MPDPRHPFRCARERCALWLSLLPGEPYRLLFPTGALLAILGAALWPLHAWGMLAAYPAVPHARIMAEGFLGAFAMGFLGTAVPRLIGAPGLTAVEATSMAALLIAAAILHVAGLTLPGDQVFLLALLSLVASLGARAFVRKDLPPPSFALAGMGLLSAFAGVALFLFGPLADLPPWHDALARLLLYQGFFLLPIMGVGAFLLPRFFNLPNRQDFPESLAPPKGWTPASAWAFACGIAMLLTFIAEALGHRVPANLARLAIAGGFLFTQLPIHRARPKGTIARCAFAALVLLLCSFPAVALAPEPKVAWVHVLFIGGFGLLTIAVATRVILGHGGASHLFPRRIRALLAFAILAILALATRVSADFLPDIRLSHLAYAAVAWIAGVVVWGWAILPRVAAADEE